MTTACKHWSPIEYLHQTVTNPDIIICGTHSYYSGAYNGYFQEVAVRYLYGDAYSTSETTGWQPKWHIDRLFGDYVQIAAGAIFMIGANNTHNSSLISTYPFLESECLQHSHQAQGDTIIGHDSWIGTGALILPGITLGNGSIIGSGSVVTKDIPPYTFAAGNPAKVISQRFSDQEVSELLALQWWHWPEKKVQALKANIQRNDVYQLVVASQQYDLQKQSIGVI
ncbi:MAG: CatB-related O-acetyltransferase [Candidatus Symbiodolus clandestinus]